ncbi:uncharacterized protein LOC105835800 [Monomorium pharaonis]|uniref:uncharacterized protein LOC105835800 n=1 Tax=Monomorium pharaonis TaxID=307658 RepID=UPI00063FCFF8|nr:uncharacterized protein LOC105835800 [Monomorium pharaonis]
MSRQISRFLLFYLSVSAILAYGLSRRIPRGASCPSCSQDCPEALTVQLPWSPRQESKLQDISVSPYQNSPYSRFIQRGISQDIEHDDNIPLSQNSMPFGNFRRFFQQEPTTKHSIFKDYLNNDPRYLDRQEIFSQDKPARGYPPVVPSRQIFDKSENLFFRNPRNKYSDQTSSLSGDYKKTKDYLETEEDPMSKVQVVYRADKDANPLWKSSRDISSNIFQSDRSFENIYGTRQEDILDEERNAIKKSSNSISQLRYPQERYNPIGFDLSEVKRDSYIKDRNIPKSTKEFLDNWDIAKDSSRSLNLGQSKNNLLEEYPAEKQEIIVKDDTDQINSKSYDSKFSQDSNIWKSRKDEESLDSLMKTNARSFENEEDAEDMKKYFDDRTEPFVDDEDMKEYFEDKTEYNRDEDTIPTLGIERDNYKSLPQNIWKGTESDEFLDLDFMRENSQESGQLRLYSDENDEYPFFEDEQNEGVIFQDKPNIDAETARAPVINAYNAYILPRYLNIVNDKKDLAKSETPELEAKSNLHVNPVIKMNHKFFEDDAIIEDNARIQDLILSKNNLDVQKYSNPIPDKRNNVKNKNEALTELDPDLLDDIEDPPVGTTESTPM